MAEIFVRHLTRWQAENDREKFADMFVEAYAEVAGGEFRGREGFLERFAVRARQPGFDMVVASAATVPTGCAFGHPVDRDGDWWQDFDGEVPRRVDELTASGQVFEVADLMVLPQHLGKGIGRRLHDELLEDRDELLGVLVTDWQTPTGEDYDYSGWGWRPYGEVRAAAGQHPRRVWIRPLAREAEAVVEAALQTAGRPV
ncbi:hypothetical protein GCM10010406_37060 [Streptomyces thermolineatus]|uniref:N-acetyltransferase domain-containing protein n=1 Tax=Streptomyces thermolineatus TaxID=44033 RepID=A0ABP5ZGM4_9ACTN